MLEQPDVLIVGAGLSGAIAALTLVEAGFRVVCLEQGDRLAPGAYPGPTREWELLSRTQWSPNPNIRRSSSDYPINADESEMMPLMFNGLGGSTVLFGAQWSRFHPSDFRMKRLDGVGDDWPFGWRDLWPFYDVMDKEMGVSGLAGDPAFPAMAEPPLPPLPIGTAGRLVARGMDRLGWHWWPGTNAIASRPYEGRRPCVQRGTCMSGCAEGAKASTDVTHWPRAIALGAKIILGATVRALPTSTAGLVTGALYIDRSGVEQFQPASVVLLAANGIGTPRLLLLSASSRYPDGLANSSGLVGKRLMLHQRAEIIGLFGDRFESWQGHYGQALHSFQFYETDGSRGFVRGAKWDLFPTGGPLAAGLSRHPQDQVWGAALHERVAQRLGHATGWGILGEDLPDERNAVTLDTLLQDGNGIPAPRVIYQVSENSKRLVEFHVRRAAESLRAAGAYEVIGDPLPMRTSAHLMGTARMGTFPSDSVVDPWGCCHDVPNLYVIDGSVFVTAGGVNPGATIAALAKRAVTHLIQKRRDQPVAA